MSTAPEAPAEGRHTPQLDEQRLAQAPLRRGVPDGAHPASQVAARE